VLRELELVGLAEQTEEGILVETTVGHALLGLHTLFANSGEHDVSSIKTTLTVFNRLISGLPLAPLTGEDYEWEKDDKDGELFKNVRCPSVFKDATIENYRPFDCRGYGFIDRGTDAVYFCKHSLKFITFPYFPPDTPIILYSDTFLPVDKDELDAFKYEPVFQNYKEFFERHLREMNQAEEKQYLYSGITLNDTTYH
jgi:hypothetical protein